MNNSSSPKLVAEVIHAITSKEPKIRYVVGDDAESMMKIRK